MHSRVPDGGIDVGLCYLIERAMQLANGNHVPYSFVGTADLLGQDLA